MRVTLLMAWNQIIQLIRIRSVLLMLIGLPLLLIFLLGNALDSEIKPVKLSLYIGDTAELGHAAEQYLASASVKLYIEPHIKESDAEVQADILQDRVDFGFSIDEDFSTQVRGGQGEVHYYPGKFEDRNMTAESVLNGLLQEISINQAAASVLPVSSQSTTSPAGAPDERVRVGTLLAGDNVDFGAVSALQYYSVAYLIMFLLYSGMSAAISLTEERDQGTMLRLYAMPVSLNAMLFGKLIGISLFAFLQATIIVAFTKTVYGVDWGVNYGGIALICILVSVATICFAVIIASFIRSRRAIDSTFTLLITCMTFISGGMIADLGPSIQRFGKFTINHWANEALRQMMSGGSLNDSWREVVILSAITVVLLGISVIRFRKAVALS
jgi:ABC-2 type transport system permease protein